MEKLTPELKEIFTTALKRNPGAEEFHQALLEILSSVSVIYESDGPVDGSAPEGSLPWLRFHSPSVLASLSEPERISAFRVTWTDRHGRRRVNRGFRIVHSTACGPGKGGLRFRDGVHVGELMFLALEQTLKNSLTGLPLGGSKGGCDVDMRGLTDVEVMNMCQAFATELIADGAGLRSDVPAGDIGVGGRELGYIFGAAKRITRRFDGVITGKGVAWGGSRLRTEATGYGAVEFLGHCLYGRLNPDDDTVDPEKSRACLAGVRCLISGSGNVALHAAQRLIALGAVVASLSDSAGTVHFTGGKGCDEQTLNAVFRLKNVDRGRLSDLFGKDSSSDKGELCDHEYLPGSNPWSLGASGTVAFPCATQNEIRISDARALVASGISAVAEGANMPTTTEAVDHFLSNGVTFAPAKACNAGGVAVSGLEMQQNAAHTSWAREEVEAKLYAIMKGIYVDMRDAAKEVGKEGNFVVGANIAGFKRVAIAIHAEGHV